MKHLKSPRTLASALLGVALLSPWAVEAVEAKYPQVHVYQSGAGGIYANAYLIETRNGVVAIDSTLSNSDSRALRARLDAIGKPLLAVLLTHGHPDHYNGVTTLIVGMHVPVIATQGIAEVIRSHDVAKEAQWKPVFKDEWPDRRTFPNQSLANGKSLIFDRVRFTVHALGVGESDADSIWMVTAPAVKLAFIGDVVLYHEHAYLSDGHSGPWLKNIERVRRLVRGASTIYPGHGDAGGTELLDWERDYLTAYRQNVAGLAVGKAELTEPQKEELERQMLTFFPSDHLQFLIKLGADPVAGELAGSVGKGSP
jgi:glyoxylase-like metal-dependent hydrolase (beta-lactamase superfamily II)